MIIIPVNIKSKIKLALLLMLLTVYPLWPDTMDSLETLLKTTKGKDRIELLNSIVRLKMNRAPRKSLEMSYEARELAKEYNDKKAEARATTNIGNGYYYLGDYDKAFQYMNEALEQYRKLNSAEGIAIVLSNLGLIYRDWENYDMAIDRMKKALAIFDSLGHKIGVASCLNNIGTVYQMRGDTANTMKYFEESLKIKTEMNDKYGMAKTINNLAIIEMNRGNYGHALKLYMKSLRLKKNINDVNGIANTYLNIAILYQRKKEYDSLLKYSMDALNLVKDKGIRQIENEAYGLISEYYKEKGDYKQALNYIEKYNTLKDSIFNETSMKKILGYQARIDLEKIEKENEILRLENEFYSKANIYIYAIIALSIVLILVLFILYKNKKKSLTDLEEKSQQISHINKKLSDQNWILNHNKQKLAEMNEKLEDSREKLRITNSIKDKFFYVITNQMAGTTSKLRETVSVLYNRRDKVEDEFVRKSIEDLSRDMATGSRMYDNILRISKAQVETINFKPEKINLKKAAFQIIKNDEKNIAVKNINVNLDIDDDVFVYASPNIIETILDILINNAIKNTPAPGGNITLKSRNVGDYYEVEIKNPGSSLNPAEYSRYFNSDQPLSDMENGDGTGFDLFICKEFVKIIGGRIWIESEKGKELRIKFTIAGKPDAV